MSDTPDRSIIVAPPILPADFGRLAEAVRAVDAAGADWIQSSDFAAAIAAIREAHRPSPRKTRS